MIASFVEYLNAGRIQEAYAMLTEESKQIQFPTVQSFANTYVRRVFSEYRIHNTQIWISERNSHTYRVTFLPDILATGNTSNANRITDYITVVRVAEDEYRLNISGYIGRTVLGNSATRQGVEITAVHKDIFMDYQLYQLEIRNRSDNNILLNSFDRASTIFIQDQNENRFNSQLHEIDNNLLHVERNSIGRLNIRFNKMHGTAREVNSINFTNIIMEAQRYVQQGISETESIRIIL